MHPASSALARAVHSLRGVSLRSHHHFLRSLLPKGFGRSADAPPAADAPKDAPGAKPEGGASSSSTGSSAGSGRGSSGGGGGGGAGGRPPRKDPNSDTTLRVAAAVGAGVAGLYLLSTVSHGLGADGSEISWQEFRNTYLATGMVDRLEVVNKEHVRVHLRNTPNMAFLEGSLAGAGGGAGGGGGAGASASAAAGSADFLLDGLRPEREAELRKAVADARAHRALHFRVGTVEGFERMLEDAQLDLRARPRDFVLVRHVNEVSLATRALDLLPYALMLGAYAFMLRMGGGLGGGGKGGGGPGGMGRMFSMGKAKPNVFNKDTAVKVTFKDVAGCDEAKAEIMEFVQFLKDPSKFTALGAKIPAGALLVGPPGTGKTLLAKATAGEAGVPFLSMSGSDFIEMFVGVGPSRVRDLFEQARASAPCIVFIDEIDAVARARNKGGFGGGNDERENTLNQLLVEMDGFNTTEGVLVLGGTNRVDILDKAILRPGRFDRQIMVDKPDIKGRLELFRIHMKPIKLAEGQEEAFAQRLAALTPGFAGADIANICNEAAIQAARGAGSVVTIQNFEAAIDRVRACGVLRPPLFSLRSLPPALARWLTHLLPPPPRQVIGGLERRNSLMTPEEKRTVAYHEAGHAVAGWFLEHADPLLKVTIIPRSGGALGFAQYLPKEVALFSEQALIDRMCMALGGRVAEELTFGAVTTGASDDLQKVTQMAYAMTSLYGMNARVGRVSFPRKDSEFEKPYSEATAQVIDEEVRALVDSCYARTRALLQEHAASLKGVAELLLQRETISQVDLVAIAGERRWAVPAGVKEYLRSAGGGGGGGGEGAAGKGAEGKRGEGGGEEAMAVPL